MKDNNYLKIQIITLCQQGGITEETIQTINKFRQMGNLFGVVTDRDYLGSFELFKNIQRFPFDFIIASNGAIAFYKDGKIYFAEKISERNFFGEKTIAQDLITQILQLTSKPCEISLKKTSI